MLIRKISGGWTGGVIGTFAAAGAVWLAGRLGFASFLGINLAPKLTPAWMYPRLAWGGAWGLLFLLPLLKDQHLLRGILFSLAPTLMVFLKYVPGLEKNLFGLSFGAMPPELILIIHFVWGIVAAFWYREALR